MKHKLIILFILILQHAVAQISITEDQLRTMAKNNIERLELKDQVQLLQIKIHVLDSIILVQNSKVILLNQKNELNTNIFEIQKIAHEFELQSLEKRIDFVQEQLDQEKPKKWFYAGAGVLIGIGVKTIIEIIWK